MNDKTDGQCAKEALWAFAQTKTGKWALGIMFSIVSFLGFVGVVPEDDARLARDAHSYLKNMSEDLAKRTDLLKEIHDSEDMPRSVKQHLAALYRNELNAETHSFYFMMASQRVLPEFVYDMICSRAGKMQREFGKDYVSAGMPLMEEELLPNVRAHLEKMAAFLDEYEPRIVALSDQYMRERDAADDQMVRERIALSASASMDLDSETRHKEIRAIEDMCKEQRDAMPLGNGKCYFYL